MQTIVLLATLPAFLMGGSFARDTTLPKIEPLLQIESTADELVAKGEVALAEFLDSGAVDSYVPDFGE